MCIFFQHWWFQARRIGPYERPIPYTSQGSHPHQQPLDENFKEYVAMKSVIQNVKNNIQASSFLIHNSHIPSPTFPTPFDQQRLHPRSPFQIKKSPPTGLKYQNILQNNFQSEKTRINLQSPTLNLSPSSFVHSSKSAPSLIFNASSSPSSLIRRHNHYTNTRVDNYLIWSIPCRPITWILRATASGRTGIDTISTE